MDGQCPDTHADSLEGQWVELLDHERRFIRDHLPDVEAGLTPLGTYPGLLPYSRKRGSIQVWRDLYRPHVLPRITRSEYEATVRRCLTRRRKAHNPPPHFVGLLAGIGGLWTRLSRAGEHNLNRLRDVAPGRVHELAITALVGGNTTTFTSEPIRRGAGSTANGTGGAG